jgi:predicted transposase/invertase (TIGR01784 family)
MTFQPADRAPYQILTKTARIIFVELEKFNPKNADVQDLLTAWLAFLKDPALMDDSFLKVEGISDAMNWLKYISSDGEVRAIADLRQRTINDRNSELTVATEKGMEDGIAIGKEEGIAIGKKEGIVIGEERGALAKARETAIKMLNKNVPVEDISDFIGLSIDEIQSIKKDERDSIHY